MDMIPSRISSMQREEQVKEEVVKKKTQRHKGDRQGTAETVPRIKSLHPATVQTMADQQICLTQPCACLLLKCCGSSFCASSLVFPCRCECCRDKVVVLGGLSGFEAGNQH